MGKLHTEESAFILLYFFKNPNSFSPFGEILILIYLAKAALAQDFSKNKVFGSVSAHTRGHGSHRRVVRAVHAGYTAGGPCSSGQLQHTLILAP